MQFIERVETGVAEEQRVLSPWVSLPTDNDTDDDSLKNNGLIYLDSLKKLYIYRHIQIFDKMFDSSEMTRNCFTVRNKFYQQIYYIGTDGNRTPGRVLPFTLRVVDQYNNLVIVIKKYMKPFFSGDQTIDIECPPGVLLAKMVRNKVLTEDSLFFIYGPNSTVPRFVITRNERIKSKNEFKILSERREPITSICKRYERILAVDKTVVHEDHYIRVNIEDPKEELEFRDKAIVLSAALIVDIFFFAN